MFNRERSSISLRRIGCRSGKKATGPEQLRTNHGVLTPQFCVGGHRATRVCMRTIRRSLTRTAVKAACSTPTSPWVGESDVPDQPRAEGPSKLQGVEGFSAALAVPDTTKHARTFSQNFFRRRCRRRVVNTNPGARHGACRRDAVPRRSAVIGLSRQSQCSRVATISGSD